MNQFTRRETGSSNFVGKSGRDEAAAEGGQANIYRRQFGRSHKTATGVYQNYE